MTSTTGRTTTPLWPVAIARMMIGVLWLYALRWKLPPTFDGRGQRSLEDWLRLEVEHAAFPFYGALIEDVVLANLTAFSWLVFLSELLVGLSLLLGLLTRLGSGLGLLLSLNLGIGLLDVPGEWPWSYAMLAMWHGLFLVSGSGRLYGLDARVRQRPLPALVRHLT